MYQPPQRNGGRIDAKLGYFYGRRIIYFPGNSVSRAISDEIERPRKRGRVRADWNSEGYSGFRGVWFDTSERVIFKVHRVYGLR